jgi:hypothetical protein
MMHRATRSARGRAGLTDAEVDDELEALAATVANATAEQAKQEAAEKARRRIHEAAA